MFTFNKKKKSNPYKDGINSFDSAINMVEKVAQTDGGFFFKKEASKVICKALPISTYYGGNLGWMLMDDKKFEELLNIIKILHEATDNKDAKTLKEAYKMMEKFHPTRK